MSAKKSDFGLIIKLLVALAIGAFLGRMANVEVMDAVASVKYALGQIIFYAVPLVIVGFITPAIARLGQNLSLIHISPALSTIRPCSPVMATAVWSMGFFFPVIISAGFSAPTSPELSIPVSYTHLSIYMRLRVSSGMVI